MRTHFARALVFLTILGVLTAFSCLVRTSPGHSRRGVTHAKHKKAKKHKHRKHKKHKKHKKAKKRKHH